MTQNTSEAVSSNPLEFKIEKILVPLDFSPASMEALDYAVWLAKQFRAAIHLASGSGPQHGSYESELPPGLGESAQPPY